MLLSHFTLSAVLGFALAAACGMRAFVPLWLSVVYMQEHMSFPARDSSLQTLLLHPLTLIVLCICVMVEFISPHLRRLHHLYHPIQTPLVLVCGTLIEYLFCNQLDAIPRIAAAFAIGGISAVLVSLSVQQLTDAAGSERFHRNEFMRSAGATVVSICALIFPLMSILPIAVLICVGMVGLPLFLRKHF